MHHSQYLSALGSWGLPITGLIATELAAPLTGTGTDGNPLTQAQATARQKQVRAKWDCLAAQVEQNAPPEAWARDFGQG